MTIPSGPISMSDISIELGLGPTYPTTLNDGAARALAGIPSGGISLSHFAGLRNPIYVGSGTFSGGSASINVGSPGVNQALIVALTQQGDSNTPGVVSLAVNGVSMNLAATAGHTGGVTSLRGSVFWLNAAAQGTVTISNAGTLAGYGVWRYIGNMNGVSANMQNGPFNVNLTVPVSVPQYGRLIGIGVGSSNTAGSTGIISAPGLSQNFDINPNGGRFTCGFGSWYNAQTVNVNYTFASLPGNSGTVGGGISWY